MDLSPAQLIEDALAKRTAAEKVIADTELPLLREALDALNSPEAKALTDRLSAVVAALGPGNSASLIRHSLQGLSSVAMTLPQDIARHQQTLSAS